MILWKFCDIKIRRNYVTTEHTEYTEKAIGTQNGR